MFELHTTRLVLRDLVEDDWPTIYAMSQTPAVTRYQSWLRLTSEAAARHWVQQAIYHNQLYPRQAYNLAVANLHPHQVIGWLGWGRPSDRSRGDYDFGYALQPAMWGQGYMSEALRAAVDYMFAALAATCVYGECASSNYGSARVMEKAGMTLAQQWQEHDAATGATDTYYHYTLNVMQWRQHKQPQQTG
jgi:ribosomal-protein-alanine N-acetyltransferase